MLNVALVYELLMQWITFSLLILSAQNFHETNLLLNI